MSKKLPPAPPPTVGLISSENGYMYFPYQMQMLEGRVFTAIESFGLRETQEKAAKDVLRSIFVDFWGRVQYVSPETVQKIVEGNVGSVPANY